MGRFVNQGRDNSVYNNQDSRDSGALLGQFVSYPDEINQQSGFGKVRTSDGSSAVEQSPQLTDYVLRGHFTQTDPRQKQIVYEQGAEENPFQQQTFQDYGQDGFQPQDASGFDPHSTQLQLKGADFAPQKFSPPGL